MATQPLSLKVYMDPLRNPLRQKLRDCLGDLSPELLVSLDAAGFRAVGLGLRVWAWGFRI